MQPLSYEDPHQVEQMARLAVAAMSANLAERGEAERQVLAFQDSVDQQTGFVGLLLQVVQQRPEAAVFCSVMLKNTVKRCWNPASAEHCVQVTDKQLLRTVIIDVMLHSTGAVQRNLAETIALIADVDFPMAWPDALNGIIQTLRSDADVAVQCAALSTAHSVLVKYREVGDFTEAFVREMSTIYALLLAPLVGRMERLLQVCEADSSPAALEACRGLASAVECLIDITTLDLTDEFVYKVESIANLLMRCLRLQNPVLTAAAARQDGGPLVALKSVATSCVSRFLTNYDEDFEKFAGGFLEVVWGVVADPGNAVPAMDDLVICGLELLTTACAGTTRGSFDNGQLLGNLVASVIVPNLALQEEDVEMYESEPDAYIQRDIEGSDLHTRRRAAGELVRMLVKMIPAKARPLLSAEAARLLSTGSGASPVTPGSPGSAASGFGGVEDWRAKDTGIYLTSSLALEGNHVDAQRGVTQSQLSDLVPFESFMSNTILPELLSNAPGSSPIIKADCIRVVATFRDHISTDAFPQIMQALPSWIALPDLVVSTYAAHAVDRLLLVQRGGQYIVTEQAYGPHIAAAIEAVCARLQATETPNAYMAQCLLRLLVRMPGIAAQHLERIILSTTAVLTEAAKNPSNPMFNHCLFEIVSKCVAQHPQLGPDFEAVLWPCLTGILVNEVDTFVPYALQLLAQLLGTHAKDTSEPPTAYGPLLPPLVEPRLYQQVGNIPAVVCLLTRFIANYPRYVHAQGLTDKVMSIFRMLVQSKMYDHEALNILTSMLLHYPTDVMDGYLSATLQLLLQRHQSAPTPKFVRILIIFFSMTVCVRGAADLVGRMNQIQSNLFFMVLDKVWLANMQKVKGGLERKVCIVALARLLTESADLQATPQAWAQSVFNCLRMIHDRAEADDHTSFSPRTVTLVDLAKQQQQQQQGTGQRGLAGVAAGAAAPVRGDSSNVFCPLEDAVEAPADVCAAVTNPDLYFREQMRTLISGPNGAALLQVLQQTLQPNLLALIQ